MFFSSAKEISRLIRKEMSNIYLKVTVEKNFLCLKSSSPGQFLDSSNFKQRLLNFQISCCNLKIRVQNQNQKNQNSIILIVNVLQSRSRFLLNKKINFNEKETESKMENFTNTFRVMNLLLKLI